MNANSKQEQLTVSNLLSRGILALEEASVPSSSLDAELLLAHSLGVDRTWLRAYNQDPVSKVSEVAFMNLIRRRQDFEPVAYLVGFKEFYGYKFTVTKDTLVPRPESEAMISLLLELIDGDLSPSIMDIGTGSGALGLTAKLEIPSANVILTDISHSALEVARRNADRHSLEVGFAKTNLLDRLTLQNNTYILANLPYVDKSWDFLSKDIAHEPANALYASQGGLKLIFELIDQVKSSTASNVKLLIESDKSQQEDISSKLAKLDFKVIIKSDYILAALKQS